MNNVVVHEIRIASSRNADVSIPGAHGPSCGKVCVQRRFHIRIVLDLLQTVEELIRCGGKFRDPGICQDFFVVKNAACRTAVGNSVYRTIIGFLRTEIVDGMPGCHKHQAL